MVGDFHLIVLTIARLASANLQSSWSGVNNGMNSVLTGVVETFSHISERRSSLDFPRPSPVDQAQASGRDAIDEASGSSASEGLTRRSRYHPATDPATVEPGDDDRDWIMTCRELSSYLSATSHATTSRFLRTEWWDGVASVGISSFSASDSECASKWYTWIFDWERTSLMEEDLARCRGHEYPLTHVEAITSRVTKPTECDGIPRVSIETLSYTTIVQLENILTMNYKQQAPYAKTVPFDYARVSKNWAYAQDHHPPTCALVGNDATNGWLAIYKSFYLLVPKEWGGLEMFGHPPLSRRCLFTGINCIFLASEFKLIYFEPEIASADLCGNDGRGLYHTRSPDLDSPVLTQVVPAITFDKDYRRCKFWSMMMRRPCTKHEIDGVAVNQDSQVISGPFTFTSGHLYLAYAGARASDLCSLYGPQTPLNGVMEVPLTQLYTAVARPQSGWMGSDLDLAKMIALGNTDWRHLKQPSYLNTSLQQLNTLTTLYDDKVRNLTWFKSSKLLNVADLQGPVPAANYWLQYRGEFWQEYNHSTITEGARVLAFEVPDALQNLDPSWKGCSKNDGYVVDPPLVLSVTQRHSPSAPAWAKPIISQTMTPSHTAMATPAVPRQSILFTAPTATVDVSAPLPLRSPPTVPYKQTNALPLELEEVISVPHSIESLWPMIDHDRGANDLSNAVISAEFMDLLRQDGRSSPVFERSSDSLTLHSRSSDGIRLGDVQASISNLATGRHEEGTAEQAQDSTAAQSFILQRPSSSGPVTKPAPTLASAGRRMRSFSPFWSWLTIIVLVTLST